MNSLKKEFDIHKFYIALIMAVVFFNILLILKIKLLNQAIESQNIQIITSNSDSLAKQAVPFTILEDLDNGKPVNLKEILNLAKYTLIIYFTPADCRVCITGEEAIINNLESGSMSIIGISPHNIKELVKWTQTNDYKMPVFFDKNKEFFKQMELIKTPRKMIVDSTGTILYAFSYDLNSKERQRLFTQFIKNEIISL